MDISVPIIFKFTMSDGVHNQHLKTHKGTCLQIASADASQIVKALQAGFVPVS